MPSVLSVSRSPAYTFSKTTCPSITLVEGLGVEGDVHSGATVKHRSRMKQDPTIPNLRQVHLIHSELFEELAAKGFTVRPGELGENITTQGIDLLSLPTGARLHLGQSAVVELTGLRNPCAQIDGLAQGLMAATLDRDAQGNLIRKAGVMSVVICGGEVLPGDTIDVEIPASSVPLDCV